MKNRVEKNKKIEQQIVQEERQKKILSVGKKIVISLFVFLSFVFASFYWMRFIETKRLVVKEIKVENELLPESLSGLKLVHFSDLHYKSTTGEKELKQLVEEINRLKPDIVVFTGDLLDENVSYTQEDFTTLTTLLQEIESDISNYYIKGEEDYAFSNVDQIWQDASFLSLVNQNDRIYGRDEEWIQILGIGSELKQDFHFEESFQGIEENHFTIVLLHEPDAIREIEDKTVQLALAGHSHANQIAIPYIEKLFMADNAKEFYKGSYSLGETTLYVNSGIGTSYQQKLRLLNPPTINFYRIVKK